MLHTTKPADYISAERLTEPSNCPDCGANSVVSVGVIHLGHYLQHREHVIFAGSVVTAAPAPRRSTPLSTPPSQ